MAICRIGNRYRTFHLHLVFNLVNVKQHKFSKKKEGLRQPLYFTIHDINMQCLRFLRQSRHTHYFSGNDYQHLSSGIHHNILYMEFKIVYRTVNFGVGRE